MSFRVLLEATQDATHQRGACIDSLQRAESLVEVMVTKSTLVTGFFDFVVTLAAVLCQARFRRASAAVAAARRNEEQQ